jgi:esterase/lipase superfamily enzyme
MGFLAVTQSAAAGRILNITEIESKLDDHQQLIHVEFLFDPGESAVQLEVLALEFQEGAPRPLKPIESNNPSARAQNGQYVARTTIEQVNQQRVQKITLTVPLDQLKLSEGFHQIAYQVRVLQDGKPVEHVCAPFVNVSVGKVARVTGHRTVTVTLKDVRQERRVVDVTRNVRGREIVEKEELVIRQAVPRRVRQQLPVIQNGEYSEVFAFAPPPEVQIDDPNIKQEVEAMQQVPWTPPRALRISFATTRNVVNPAARDSSRFGTNVGPLTYGTALVDITVKKTHGERPPSQEPVRPTPQDSFKVSQLSSLSEDDFFSAISNTLWQSIEDTGNTKNDVIVFVHGYNNSFRFSCVRFAQLVYDTRFEGRPVLFSWPANGGDTLVDELSGILSYGSDREDAKASVQSLAMILQEIALDARKPENAAAKRGDIHLIAHSMGCQLLVDALEKLQSAWPAGTRPFKSIILAAPDVDPDDLTRLLLCVRTPAERVTLYYCEADRALWASSQFHAQQTGQAIRQRVGQALCILPEIENVDANKANTTFIGHSYFVDGSLVLRDLEDIVLRDYGPELRVLCPDNKLPEEYAYWKIIDEKTNCETPVTRAAATTSPPTAPSNPAPRRRQAPSSR